MLNPRRVTAKYPGALVLVVARLVANGRVYGLFVRVRSISLVNSLFVCVEMAYLVLYGILV